MRVNAWETICDVGPNNESSAKNIFALLCVLTAESCVVHDDNAAVFMFAGPNSTDWIGCRISKVSPVRVNTKAKVRISKWMRN